MTSKMRGVATCFGAASIVNGIVTGKGASFGIGLKTVAIVDITNEPGRYSVSIEGDPREDPNLSVYCVRNVLRRLGLYDQYGADIKTESEIPISRGLKSSSAVSNALTLATLKALGEKWDDLDVINSGINASLEAKVTITGAFDDACATYFGNVAVCDNIDRKIIDQYTIEEDLCVLIHVPKKKIRKIDVDKHLTKDIIPIIQEAFQDALRKDFDQAMIKNGASYGSVMGLDTTIAEKAMGSGAISAGISGTGPSTVILCHHDVKSKILGTIGKESIIETDLNRTKAWAE
jgi:shikimate kinase